MKNHSIFLPILAYANKKKSTWNVSKREMAKPMRPSELVKSTKQGISMVKCCTAWYDL